MAFEVNSVTISGNLTRDPELRALSNGTSVCQLSIAHNESYKDASQEWQTRPHFFIVEVWGGQGEWAFQNLRKGQKIVVCGKLRQERWEKDGENRSTVKLRAETLFKIERGEPGAAQPEARKAEPESDFGPEDVPY